MRLTKLLDSVLAWYYRRLRKMDLQMLWPAMRAATPYLSAAQAAFAAHAFRDRAWLYLGKAEIRRIVNDLK